MPRYALLRHTGAPDDPHGCHFDLLLEDGETCRTWRLNAPPCLDRPPQAAAALPAHRLAWLEPRSAAVSGNRGWAERVMAGRYSGVLPHNPGGPVQVQLRDGDLIGTLLISNGTCRIQRA